MEGFIIQPYDLLMLGLLVGLAVLGAWKGVAWQIAALSSLVVSWLVAVRFAKVLAPMISDHEPWNGFIAMLLLYLGTSLAIWSFFRLVKGMIDRVQLKDFDRQMGALFGLVKGVLWCLLITFFAVTLSETSRQWVLQSKSGYYTTLLIRHGTPILPEDVRNLLGKYIKQLDEGLEQPSTGEPVFSTDISDPRQGSGDSPLEFDPFQSRTAANFRDDARDFIDFRADQMGRRINDTGDRIRGEVHQAARRGFNELDDQIRRLPLEPVRR